MVLAERLGKTLREIEDEMDADELTKWRAYDERVQKLTPKKAAT